ncbi:MAG: DUF6179 domain-containing protein [Blautia sp.]|nr:DUF6179 domain-containing protein [Blautia sp.]MDY5031124.1 DUF6179 domain-containing protein [Blautia sp.]
MNYEMEELVPVVGKLAEKYTGHESTSVTYEKAEQLMEAVIYCISEGEQSARNSLSNVQKGSAQQAYEIGLACVKKKVKTALGLYNEMLPGLDAFENRCFYDTVIKGLPEFFKWYDPVFEPQNTLLTLDYPVLKDLSAYKGIDRIYEYIRCVELEQRFLGIFPNDHVRNILYRYDKKYRLMIENICEIVLADTLGHILVRKSLQEPVSMEDCRRMQEMLCRKELGEITALLQQMLKAFLEQYCKSGGGVAEYLEYALQDLSIRLKNAAEHGNVQGIFFHHSHVRST